MEDLASANVTGDLFEKQEYGVNYLSGNRLVSPGDIVYKIYDNEKWSIAFPTTDLDKAQSYLDEEHILKIAQAYEKYDAKRQKNDRGGMNDKHHSK